MNQNSLALVSDSRPPSGPRLAAGGARRAALPRWRRGCALLTFVLLAPLAAISLPGCSRPFWRKQADLDVYNAEMERLADPRWMLPRLDVTPDPESRFFDPHDPDFSPLPPDDPQAHSYMHWVDGWQGYKGWHKLGDRLSVENPAWLLRFGISPDQIDPQTGRYLVAPPRIDNLTIQDAVELAQIHSRDYQFEIEDLYLSALAVTFERFQFGVRYLGIGGNEPRGNVVSDARPGRVGRATADAAIGVSQLLPAGGQWAVELANNTVWLFSGGNQTNSASILSYSLVQPLLINAGRKLVLENLTQAERSLLYQTRELARFRQQLFTDLVGGGGAGGSTGYLGLIQATQGVMNEEGNLYRIQRQVDLLEAVNEIRPLQFRIDLAKLPEGFVIPEALQGKLSYSAERKLLIWVGTMTDDEERVLKGLSTDANYQDAISSIIIPLRIESATLDVLQLKTSYTQAVQRLRIQRRALQDQLDNYKIALGLPPDMELSIDQTLLKQFELVDESLRNLEIEVMDFVPRTWAQLDVPPDGVLLPPGQEHVPSVEQLRTVIDEYERVIGEVTRRGVALVRRDIDRLVSELPDRLGQLSTEENRDRLKSDFDRDQRIFDVTLAQLDKRRVEIAGWRETVSDPQLPKEQREMLRLAILDEHEKLLQITRNLGGILVGVRAEMISVRPYQIGLEDSVALGVENRLDLMNARANVMDARRQIEVAANRLRAQADVVLEGNIGTSGGNRPFDFRRDQSSYRFGMRFTAPLDQILERNSYRRTLIDYERTKRAYMLAEDTVKQQIRRDWRQLQVLRENLETSKQAIRFAAAQYDLAVDEALRPKAPGQAATRGTGLQGNNLLGALNSILQAQNSLIANWVDYERNRLNIHRDMGIMDLGEDGVWNDPFYRDARIFKNESEPAELLPDLDPVGATSLVDPLPVGDWLDRSGSLRDVRPAGLEGDARFEVERALGESRAGR